MLNVSYRYVKGAPVILVTPALPAPRRNEHLPTLARPRQLRTVLPLSPADPDPKQHVQRRLVSRFAQAEGLATGLKGDLKGRLVDISA